MFGRQAKGAVLVLHVRSFAPRKSIPAALSELTEFGEGKEWRDEIVEEVRTARDTYARRFGYDVEAICNDLKQRQDEGVRKVVQDTSSMEDLVENQPQTGS